MKVKRTCGNVTRTTKISYQPLNFHGRQTGSIHIPQHHHHYHLLLLVLEAKQQQ